MEEQPFQQEQNRMLGTICSAIILSIVYLVPSTFLILNQEYDFLSSVIIGICAGILVFIIVGIRLYFSPPSKATPA